MRHKAGQIAAQTLLRCLKIPSLAAQMKKLEQDFIKVAMSSMAAHEMLTDLLHKLKQ
jgi:hypothetical protein